MNEHAEIAAIVTMKPENIQGGGTPVFVVNDQNELQTVSMTLEKIMDAAAHEIDTKTLIIVVR